MRSLNFSRIVSGMVENCWMDSWAVKMIIWCLLCLFIETSLVLLESPNYVVKPIQFCPLVTLRGSISHYLDTGAYIHRSATSPAECSLLCTVNQAGRCAGFTHNPLTGSCSIHYSLNSGPFSMTSVVFSSPAYPTTYMVRNSWTPFWS